MKTEVVTTSVAVNTPQRLLAVGPYDRAVALIGGTFAPGGNGRVIAPSRDSLVAGKTFHLDVSNAMTPTGIFWNFRVPRGSDLWILNNGVAAANTIFIATEISRPRKLPKTRREFRTGRAGLGANVPQQILVQGRTYDTDITVLVTVNTIVLATSRDDCATPGKRFTIQANQTPMQFRWGRGSDLWAMLTGAGTQVFQFAWSDLDFSGRLEATRLP